jgi:hypothetical protein
MDPVFCWTELTTTARKAPTSNQPFPSPIVRESVVKAEIYPCVPVKFDTKTEEKFVLRATKAFVKTVFVVLIVDATNELVKKALVVMLRATNAFVKSVFVVLIVDASNELVNRAFVLSCKGGDEIYPIVPNPRTVD